MTVNLSSSLTGLSLLAGANAFTSSTAIAYESKAVRTAKAAFTLAPTTPPWKEAASSLSDSTQVSAIKAMATRMPPSAATKFQICEAMLGSLQFCMCLRLLVAFEEFLVQVRVFALGVID